MSARASLRQALGRVTLLLLWSLVGWGAVLLLSTLANALAEGPSSAFARLLPRRGAALWGWLSPLCVLLALAAGLIGGALVVSRRWERGTSPEE